MKHAFKKIMAFLLVIAMVISVLPSVFAAGYVEPFKDVKEDDWFAPYVTYAYNISGGAVVRWYRDSLAFYLKEAAKQRRRCKTGSPRAASPAA